MPNPKDFMDDEHDYVRGYARRKPGIYTASRISWFWRIDWYWRLIMIVILGAVAVTVVFLVKDALTLLGIFLAIVILYWFFHPLLSRQANRSGMSKGDKKIARRIFRKII